MEERRRHPRYRAREGAYAFVQHHEHITTRIVEIGRGGLSLLYSADRPALKQSCRLDLFFSLSRSRLEGLPFEVVSDTDMAGQDPSENMPLRRLGGKFGDLSEDQVSKLNYFIRNFTL